MEQVEFEVEKLKVMIYTNITNSKDEMVEFNRSMLHIPKSADDETTTQMTLANIPFFTSDIEYPITRLNRMNYHDRVNFFFNQKYFIDILRPYYKPKQEVIEEDVDNKKPEVTEEDVDDDESVISSITNDETRDSTYNDSATDETRDSTYNDSATDETRDSTYNDSATDETRDSTYNDSATDKSNYTYESYGWLVDNDDTGTKYYDDRNYSERERITRKNIKTMLEILFPTKFPVINDIQTSYEYIHNQKSTRPFWFNPFQKHYFSYLTIGGKIYTIKKTVWLNDLLNHPVYQKIFIEYRKLKKWADEKGYNMKESDKSRLKDIFKKSLKLVHPDYTRQIPIINFQNTMSGFISPLRNSSNTKLQELIDGLLSKDNKPDKIANRLSKDFYELLDDIYDTYINIDSVRLNENDSKKNISGYINTGIGYINIGETNKPTREVYFMIDLIDGEVNDENKSSIYCPYMGDTLGNKLEYLINTSQTDKNKWAVDKNRQIFSLSNMEESGTEYTQKMEEGPSNPSKNVGYKQLEQSNRSSNAIPISIEVSNNFSTYILKVEKGKPDEVKDIIENLKKKYIDINITSMDKSRLLESMQNLGTLSNKLVNIIIQWSKNIHVQNYDVIDSLITIKTEINGQIERNVNKKKRYSVEMYDTSGQEKLKIDRDTEINNLLLLIVDKLQKHEASKKRRISGGTKKKKTRSKKNTRRRRK
jgi:hypothetical protein